MTTSKSCVDCGGDFVVMYTDVPRKSDSLAADTCSFPIGRHNLVAFAWGQYQLLSAGPKIHLS